MNRIDVIIPTRNAPSILAQTLTHYWANVHDPRLVASVTILDNASTAPGMDAILAEAHRRRIQIIRHEKNIGVWTSLNRGLVLGRSGKVFIVTSDILLAPDALKWLDAIQDDTGCAFLGPEVISDRQEDLWRLYEDPLPAQKVDYSTYNGACWLMTRECIEKVGYFDSRFYVCYGDLDYTIRIKDADLSYGVTEAVRCVHLDKQSRQADHSVNQDNEMEIKDWTRFAEKYGSESDILQAHPRPDQIMYALIKERYWHNLA